MKGYIMENNDQPDNQDQAQAKPAEEKIFNIDLFQSHWQRSHTERFQINAKDEDEARKKALKFINEHKDLEKGDKADWDIEVSDPAVTDTGEPIGGMEVPEGAIIPNEDLSERGEQDLDQRPRPDVSDNVQPNGDPARKDDQLGVPTRAEDTHGPTGQAEASDDEPGPSNNS